MPSIDTLRKAYGLSNNVTVGQIHKKNSDFIMEDTWNSDIQSKVCYIYDYFHDDQPDKADHMTYENTTKTRIDAKFIVTKYASVDTDQVEYHLLFKPSQAVEFQPTDELFYYETDFRNKYRATFPVGLYGDIPDDKGVYHKWLFVQNELGNQFVKYLIMPCNYQLMWIEKNGNEKYKRKMWGVARSQSSYNSGLWSDLFIVPYGSNIISKFLELLETP